MVIQTRLQRYAPGLAQPPHRHDTASVTLLLRGQLRERSGGDEVAAGPLSLVVKPAGTVHADLFGPSSVVTCQIELDPTIHDDRRWGRVMSRWRWVTGGLAVASAMELAGALARGAPAEEVAELATSVLGALDPARTSNPPPGWLRRAIELVEDELARGTQRIPAHEVATAVGVHAVHLSRVFRSQFGVPFSTWVRRRRVQRAAEAITATRGTLSAVAAACGFADHSHMNRAFRRDMGVLPAGYRDLAHVVRG